MKVTYRPLLQTQRELYDVPLGWDRFKRYIWTITGGGDDVELMPLVAMNPMGKPHVAALLDRLIALDADGVAGEATAEAERRLSGVGLDLQVGLVVADDALGGWTNRYLSEAKGLFELGPAIKRRWVTARLWTGDEASQDDVRESVLSAICRAAHFHSVGQARTLRQVMAQEGAAAAFAAARGPLLSPDELESTRLVIEPHLDSEAFPVVFACLYGDEPATSVGYPPRGLPTRAGFALALHDARARGVGPEAILTVG